MDKIKNWIVVADKKRTRIYETEKTNRDLKLVRILENDYKERPGNLKMPGEVEKSGRHFGLRSFADEEGLKRRMYDKYTKSIADFIKKRELRLRKKVSV